MKTWKASTGWKGLEGLLSLPHWVVFDAVGTLIHPVPSVAEVYLEIGHRYGSELTEEQIKFRFKEAFSHAFQLPASPLPGPTTNETIEFERWRQIVRGTLSDLDEPSSASAFEDLWKHFADPRHWRVYSDMVDIPARFAAQGIRVAVASNLDSRLEPILHHFFGKRSIEKIFVSSQVGWSKPDIRFYKEIARALGCNDPGRLCMIGDDPINDVQAPIEAGWTALLIAH